LKLPTVKQVFIHRPLKTHVELIHQILE